jgi:prephenate dehydrogenase
MKTAGIIGFGSFGAFLAQKLDPHMRVKVFAKGHKGGKWAAALHDVAKADYVVLAVPFDAYEEVLQLLKKELSPRSVLVDVCSVKEKPIAAIKAALPNQPLVATHPLFGPESAKHSLKGHKLVICPEASDPAAMAELIVFAKHLGLEVIKMSAAAHDKEIATVQGLTFFIAHALKDMKLHDQKLATASFDKLLNLAELEKHHSQELFMTMQAGNKNAGAVRQRFIDLCKALDTEVERQA